VFARGFDATTNDPNANNLIDDFFARNQKVLGRVALMALQRSKDHDGNLFFTMFSDPGTGDVDVRMIDATEIQDIWTDPEDADLPRYYRRVWTQRAHDAQTAASATVTREAWYPALNYDPAECRPPEPKLTEIQGHPVMWDSPVHHRKVGAVGKWLFGCPRIYPMIDWAKEARRFLEACASVRQSLSQYASTVTTKGGQAAIEGIKQQLQTQVGPGAPIWDSNPPAIAGSTFISGPGTTMEAFKVQGSTFSPEDVRQYKLMCCMVMGVPETFLGDVSTGNLATATSLDRPTETVFLSLQEEWTEDLVVLLTYVLKRSLKAPGGKLRESCPDPGAIRIREAERVRLPSGGWRYAEAKNKRSDDIEVRVTWPAIREGDVPALIGATVQAMTLGNHGGQVVGIDEKVGVKVLYRQLDVEDGDEEAEKQYPEKEYDPDRTKEVLPPPVPKLPAQGGVQPAPNAVATAQPGGNPSEPAAPAPKQQKEAAAALRRLADTMELHG